jgi:hypothetical protein
VRGEDDLFGGGVPRPFAATKAITHPLVGPDARAPAGWPAEFGGRVRDAVLCGFTALASEDARRAGVLLLARGPVRLKPARAQGGLGQAVVSDAAGLDAALGAMDAAEPTGYGLVLEDADSDARHDEMRALADAVMAWHLANHPSVEKIYFRIAWEFNNDRPFGDSYRWTCYGDDFYGNKLANIIRRWVTQIRAASVAAFGENRTRIIWCPNSFRPGWNPFAAYPGDAYVQVIGTDQYHNYQYGMEAMPTYDAFYNIVNAEYSTEYLFNYAIAHDKERQFNETAYGGGPNPRDEGEGWIDALAEYCLAKGVTKMTWWEEFSAYNGQLYHVEAVGGSKPRHPRTWARYKQKFGPNTVFANGSSGGSTTQWKVTGIMQGTGVSGDPTFHEGYGEFHARIRAKWSHLVSPAIGARLVMWPRSGQWSSEIEILKMPQTTDGNAARRARSPSSTMTPRAATTSTPTTPSAPPRTAARRCIPASAWTNGTSGTCAAPTASRTAAPSRTSRCGSMA